MGLAVLDVGSNSAQLQVVDAITGAPPLPVHALKEPTRLAEEVADDGSISDAGTARVVTGVGRAVLAAHDFDVEHLYAFDDVAQRIRWEGQPRRVVVTSKTFKQLARLCGAAKPRKGPFVRRTLSATKLAACLPALRVVPPAERARMRGLSTPRAGQILAGAIVALETLRYLEIDEADVSPWALREGIILEHLAALTDTTELPLQPLCPTLASTPTDATVMALPARRP